MLTDAAAPAADRLALDAALKSAREAASAEILGLEQLHPSRGGGGGGGEQQQQLLDGRLQLYRRATLLLCAVMFVC
jgi:hypothetical protein